MPKANHRKQLQALSEPPVLEEGQKVARVIAACGENNYEVEDEHGAKTLYQLPKRMRHVVFIRGGSYVFVKDDETRKDGRVRGDIEVVVLAHFLHGLSKEPFWPRSFKGEEDNTDDMPAIVSEGAGGNSEGELGHGDQQWEIGSGNPNRAQWQDESSEEESD